MKNLDLFCSNLTELKSEEMEKINGGGWLGAIIGGIIGFFIDGPIGAIAGAIIGSQLEDERRNPS